jgi:aspartate/methionine/tyrosine aminotransferase
VPVGAFYAFPNVEGTGIDSKTLADYLLYEAGVACLDGKCFGAQGDGYLRLSYASSFENILEAVERIRRVSSKWTGKT